MRLVLWSMVFTAIVLIFWAEVSTPFVQKKHKVRPDAELPVHVTLYMDQEIAKDASHVAEAALEWSNATNGEVVFDVAALPEEHIDPTKSIILSHVTPEFPYIIVLDSLNQNSTLAYCDRNAMLPYIALVTERIDEDEFASVMMHELGHYMGLEHPDSKEHPELGMGTLMYSNLTHGSNHITQEDLEQFCRLHHCDASKYHGLPEVQ